MATDVVPYYLSVDPGKHTGWAIWNVKGEFLDMGTTHSNDELHTKLETFSGIHEVIYEDFLLFKHKAKDQVGSRMPASQAIGIIETFARQWGAKITKQPSHIKNQAELLSGMSTKKMAKSETHKIDAYNHGFFYLVKNKIIQVQI